jgi:hypothetical protein
MLLSALVANVFVRVFGNCKFSFSGAISTLAREKGDSFGVFIGFIVALDSIP